MLKYRFFQFIRIGIALFQDDIGFDLLNLVRILNADNAAHLYSLMSINDIFKLGGIDIVAAGHDHPLDALFEIDEAVGIHIAEISGMEPSIAVGMNAEGVRVLLGSVEVTYHNGRTPQADLAEFSERNGVISPDSANGIIGIRIRKTDAALALGCIRGQAACSNAFGSSVALAYMDGSPVLLKKSIKTFLELD